MPCFLFWEFSVLFQFFGGNSKKIWHIFEHSTMPCPSKKSAQASAQCHAGQGVFSTTPPIIFESDSCSAYNSSEGQTDEDSSDEDDTNTQSVICMQGLMANYLPAEMKAKWEASEQVSADSKQWGQKPLTLTYHP